MGWSIASKGVRKLERQQAVRGSYMENADSGRFTISPTCPPSTSLRFQGGLAWWPCNAFWSNGYFIPSYTVDLADRDKTSVVWQFTQPYWYMPQMVIINNDVWPPPNPWPDTVPDDFLWYYGGGEYETAAEAEDAAWLSRAHNASQYGFIAGTIIFRNNGVVGEYLQFMEIDPLNRGRSYIFDFRKRYGWELA